MRPRDARKWLKKLRDLCKANGIEMTIIPGNHPGVILRDPKTDQKIRFVIAGGREISPGVQRGIINYIRDIAPRVALAEIVRRILEELSKH